MIFRSFCPYTRSRACHFSLLLLNPDKRIQSSDQASLHIGLVDVFAHDAPFLPKSAELIIRELANSLAVLPIDRQCFLGDQETDTQKW